MRNMDSCWIRNNIWTPHSHRMSLCSKRNHVPCEKCDHIAKHDCQLLEPSFQHLNQEETLGLLSHEFVSIRWLSQCNAINYTDLLQMVWKQISTILLKYMEVTTPGTWVLNVAMSHMLIATYPNDIFRPSTDRLILIAWGNWIVVVYHPDFELFELARMMSGRVIQFVVFPRLRTHHTRHWRRKLYNVAWQRLKQQQRRSRTFSVTRWVSGLPGESSKNNNDSNSKKFNQ